MNNKSLIFFLCFVFIMVLVSSAPPTTTVSDYQRGVDIIHPETIYLENGNDLEFNFWTYNNSNGATLTNSSLNCTLYIIDDKGVQYYRFSNRPGANGLITYGKGAPLCVNCWTMILPKENITIGQYSYQIKCQGGSGASAIGGYTTGFFEVNYLGTESVVWIDIILLVFFCCLFVGTFYLNKTVNYDRWYTSIINKYTHKNYFKFTMSVIGYNLIRNGFGIYYIVIFPIVMTVTNIVLVYNVVYLVNVMPVVMYVYAWGVLLVGIMFGGQLQEFIVRIVEDAKSIKWGLKDD